MASPPGNGGRGLKLSHEPDAVDLTRASPPGNGGRGLKLFAGQGSSQADERIAPRQRGAWIETKPMTGAVNIAAGHRPPATGGVD